MTSHECSGLSEGRLTSYRRSASAHQPWAGRAGIALALAAVALSRPARAQQPAYAAAQLACSRFRERVHSTVRTESGGRTLEAITDRRGVWVVRAEAAGSSLALDAWYDSLAVTRTSAGVSVTPDAGGILGGRYQGTLASDGRYVPSVHPFIPDELAEIVRLDDALDRLFPRLPDRPLRVGESWHEPPAMAIQRMPDSADGGIPLRRYRFTASEEGQESAGGDSLPIELQQRTDERGDVVWHPTIGLLRYARSATVGTMLPPSRAMPRPMRTTLVQEAVLERVREVDAADCR